MNVKKLKGWQWTAEILQSFPLSFGFTEEEDCENMTILYCQGRNRLYSLETITFRMSGTWQTILYYDNFFFLIKEFVRSVLGGISGPLKWCKALEIPSPAVCFGEPSLVTHRDRGEVKAPTNGTHCPLMLNKLGLHPTSRKPKAWDSISTVSSFWDRCIHVLGILSIMSSALRAAFQPRRACPCANARVSSG